MQRQALKTIKAHFERACHHDPHWRQLSGRDPFQVLNSFTAAACVIVESTGDAFLLEPGEIHDGDAPVEGGFTYLTFYLDEQWLTRTLRGLSDATPDGYSLHFYQTLTRAHGWYVASVRPLPHCITLGDENRSAEARWIIALSDHRPLPLA